jgi:DNA-binding transcriptional LysR family regulator
MLVGERSIASISAGVDTPGLDTPAPTCVEGSPGRDARAETRPQRSGTQGYGCRARGDAVPVTQVVRALEERVGVRLLQRTTRSVGLTKAGMHLVAQLKPALHGIDVAFESLSALHGRPSGLLRLTMLRTGYTDVLKPKLASFLSANPDVRIDLSLDKALTNIVADGYDAGIRLGHSLDPDMIAVRVSPDQRVVVVGSPSYFSRPGSRSTRAISMLTTA